MNSLRCSAKGDLPINLINVQEWLDIKRRKKANEKKVCILPQKLG